VEALFAEGSRALEGKDFSSAERAFRKALRLAPELAETHANLGVALERTGALQEAEACYRRALALGPDGLQTQLNLGALLVNQKRFTEARRHYDQALEGWPQAAALWSNLAVLHTCQHREAEAERCCRKALELDAGYAKARYNLSYLLLRQGRFEEGWPALEARSWNLDLITRILSPRWQGESLVGRSLLIGSEGGYGDMIQFSRYTALLKRQGAARIGILCRPALTRLFTTLPGVDEVLALGEALPEPGWDAWILPMSLPLHCGTRLDSIPAPIPYLETPPDQVAAWNTRLPAGLRVGLAWRGNPQFENDADRSLPGLHLLSPLAAVAGVHFISLQKGVGEDEATQPPAGMKLINPAAWIGDFADLAALVANLDLVIAVDTAAAHLAGALGQPCWVLLPSHKTDWRWLKDREDSPWYPSLRLFRQRDGEDWSPIIQAVAAALETFAEARRRLG
jgi:tetratricopeptide (TPR) repeat protein